MFYVSSPHSSGYTARPLWEHHSAYQYSTAIFVYSHKGYCIMIYTKVKQNLKWLLKDVLLKLSQHLPILLRLLLKNVKE